jgi:hypothetical protein
MQGMGSADTARFMRSIRSTCPQCKAAMQIISFIDQHKVVKHILQHMGLWVTQKRPPPKINSPPVRAYCYTLLLAIPLYDNADPDYPFEAYLHVGV